MLVRRCRLQKCGHRAHRVRNTQRSEQITSVQKEGEGFSFLGSGGGRGGGAMQTFSSRLQPITPYIRQNRYTFANSCVEKWKIIHSQFMLKNSLQSNVSIYTQMILSFPKYTLYAPPPKKKKTCRMQARLIVSFILNPQLRSAAVPYIWSCASVCV